MKKILASNCLITKGANRSLFMDLHRSRWHTVPHLLADLLNENNFTEIELKYPLFFEILVESEAILDIFENDDISFSKMNLDYSSPSLIEDAIIDWDESSNFVISDIIIELEKLDCKFICFRFFNSFEFEILTQVRQIIETSTIESIEVYLSESDYLNNEIEINDLFDSNIRFSKLIVHSASSKMKSADWLIRTQDQIVNGDSCGNVSPLFFGLSTSHYALTANHNNCLFKKIGIDKEGNIKNCPSCISSLGKVENESIEKVISNREYLNLTEIKKEDIEICKDCEFRSICSDCRVFIDEDNNIKSRPSKCNYNPYISLWSNEENYVPVLECGYYSKDGSFIPNTKKIKNLNHQIWGE